LTETATAAAARKSRAETITRIAVDPLNLDIAPAPETPTKVENDFSIRKRGIKGIRRQCKEKHGSYRRAGIKANVYA
jgi:hypothetical protein